ncbi:site-specific integrase, partial [Rhodothermus sp. AH-315-K08]|nr:site-specific integrase [Rhodothermus sp. AH-315-K08]
RAIKEALRPIPLERTDFIAFGRAYADELYGLGKIPTGRRYRSILTKIEQFVGGQLSLSDVTVDFVRRYQVHMVEERKNGPSTVASNLRAIKSLINRAIKAGLFPSDESPFKDIQVKEPPGKKQKLSALEVRAIQDLEFAPETPAWHVRHYWLFSMYTGGVRFRDIATLRVQDVREGRLSYRMSKTGGLKNLEIPPIAADILVHYLPGRKPEEFVFPILGQKYDLSSPEKFDRAVQSQNAYVNKILKEIATSAGLPISLSFHQSRHSFANMALDDGWSVRKIQAALGHKDYQTTERYLRELGVEFTGEELGRLFSNPE